MRQAILTTVIALTVVASSEAGPPKTLASGLGTPKAVAIGQGSKVYVALLAEIVVVNEGKTSPFVKHLPLGSGGLVAFNQWLFVANALGIQKIDPTGKSEEFVSALTLDSFRNIRPGARHGVGILAPILECMTVDRESGTLYASCAKLDDSLSVVFRISQQGKVDVVLSSKTFSKLKSATGVAMDGASHLLIADGNAGTIYRLKLADGTVETIAEGLGRVKAMTWDQFGRLFFVSRIGDADKDADSVFVIPRPGAKPILLAEGFQHIIGQICVSPDGRTVLVPDSGAGTLSAVEITIPGQEVDTTPMPLQTEVAFPNLQWSGWSSETDTGKTNVFRPIVLTHAGDGSNRVFVATHQGVIHVFPNDQNATKTSIFLDIRERVSFREDQIEEGFLGLAFHPKFKENGEFFVFYTIKKPKLTNVVSRFRVSKDDPNRADPNSEEELLRIQKPFWNHDGGTLVFGPDGYLYLTHGDGGLGNDPYENGQNLKTMLGKIHRIDVDHKDPGKNYAIPKDNPFVDRAGAQPEIWAYGLRNVWRMAFDRKTGKLWAADVGQNLFEEIDLIERGGNYGWNRREGFHPFGPNGTGVRKEFIEPIWEYSHDVGKSIIGGLVYRGKRLPELDGKYLYGDWVSAKIWALTHDETKHRTVANRPIKDRNLPIYSFGEDEMGEAYLLTPTATGKGIYWFVRQPLDKSP